MEVDTESLHRYGTPLDPITEDEVLTKRPINVEDQIVTDENGKRRFHGAFTGGFSAGFWNTVGSLEGWKPAEFKSSRHEKAPQRQTQRPEDFMDAEDLGEFGIAPQRIELKTEYKIDDNSSRKRKFMQPALNASGTIPGEPALAALLQPVMKDKIAVRILKSMGWKPGQGIGPRQTAKEKKKAKTRNKREEYILRKYADVDDGDDAAGNANVDVSDDDDEDDEDDDYEITFAPDDFEPLVCRIKADRFGLGYTSLRGEAADDGQQTKKLQRFELFGPLEVLAKNDRKLAITGQGFGVGALEEEDDDIYARDDLSKYDFSLDDKNNKKQRKPEQDVQDKHIVEGFSAAHDAAQFQRPFVVELPDDFTPRNWAMRRSRFAPLAPEKARALEDSMAYRKQGLGRHDLDPAKRAAILEDSTQNETKTVEEIAPPTPAPAKPNFEELRAARQTQNERTKALLARISSKSDNFTRGGLINTDGEEISKPNDEMLNSVKREQQNLLMKANEKTKNLATTPTEFKPFISNDAKQLRYEKFIAANLRDEMEIGKFLATIQPVELSEWDREMEKKEFIQARKLYKPLCGFMSERFVSEATLDTENPKSSTTTATEKSEDTKKITMERTKEMWKPHALLCKRYNIAEPFGGSMEDVDARPAKKAKVSIFDYLETSVNTKANFQTPVIIPKHIEKPKALVDNQPAKAAAPTFSQNTTQKSEASVEKSQAAATTITESNNKEPKKNPFRQPAKTELEKRVEESRDKPASEKVELFRAIFEDSDDDDDSGEASKNANPAQLDIEKLELPRHSKAANAAEVNVLRNTSPPRGIFAALFKAKSQEVAAVAAAPSTATEVVAKASVTPAPIQVPEKVEVTPKITFKSRALRHKEAADDLNDAVDAYGPSLPKNLKPNESKTNAEATPTPTTTTLDTKILKLMGKSKTITDVWIERKSDDDDDDDSSVVSSSGSSLDSSAKKSKRKKAKKSAKKKSKKSTKKKAKSKKKHDDSGHKRKKSKQKKSHT